MPSFSRASEAALSTAHPDLQRLFREVVKTWDCAVLEGHRNKEDQDKAYRTGQSEKKWPGSLHNKTPSLAVDVAPYPVRWNDQKGFYAFGGFVLGVASQLGIGIRWGGDWNGNKRFDDQTFNDLPHFEVKPGIEVLITK